MRKLRVLGLALVAVFAMSAVAASAASATYNSNQEPTTLNGEALNTQVFETKFGEIECEEGFFTGNAAHKTETTLTVHPEYKECFALGFHATVETEGCNYVFNATSPESSPFAASAPVDIECSSGKSIKIVAAGGLCSVSVPAQLNVGRVQFKNLSGKVEVVASVAKTNEIEYSGIGGFCSGAGTGGTYEGNVEVEGNSGGASISVS